MWAETLLPFAPAASAIAASASAFAAYSAVRLNHKNQEALRLTAVYKQLVSDHVGAYLGAVRERILDLIEPGLVELETLKTTGAPYNRITERGAEMVAELKRREWLASAAMMAGAESFVLWMSSEKNIEISLDDDLERVRNAVLDKISALIVSKIGTHESQGGSELALVVGAIREHMVAVNTVMLTHEPTARRHRPRLMGKIFRLGGMLASAVRPRGLPQRTTRYFNGSDQT